MTLSAVCGAFNERSTLTNLNATCFFANLDHRIAETVERLLRFASNRLDHQFAGDGPRSSRCVESEVHQSLGNVFDAYSCAVLECPDVDYTFVRNAPL